MATSIVLLNGEKVAVELGPGDVAGQFQGQGPKQFGHAGDESSLVWINPNAVAYFYEAASETMVAVT
jgi:hypothetical protein